LDARSARSRRLSPAAVTSCVLVVFELARPAKRCATPALELANGVGTLAGCEVVLEVGQDGVGEAVVAYIEGLACDDDPAEDGHAAVP
jgi:hypothetical protein